MPHINILTDEELKTFYAIPTFSKDDCQLFFKLDKREMDQINRLRDIPSKINFILQVGYFKATDYFFTINFQACYQDVLFIFKRYFPNETVSTKQTSKRQHYSNQKKILMLYNKTLFSGDFLDILSLQGKKLAKRDVNARFMFDELLNFCQQSNVVRPAYSTMQSVISSALKKERQRLINKILSLLDKDAKTALDHLLKNDEFRYQLTLLKKDPKDFSTNEMRKEITKQMDLLRIYAYTKSILPKLNISLKNRQYYADMAMFYPIARFKRLNPNLARLYLLCYVQQRLLKVNDNLITFFIYRANKFYQKAEQYAKEKLACESNQAEEQLVKAGKLITLYSNRSVLDNELRPTAFQIVPEDEMEAFSKSLTQRDSQKIQLIWQYLGKRKREVAINLRPIFQAIQFVCNDNNNIHQAMDFMREYFDSHRPFKTYSYSNIPLKFIPSALESYVTDKTPDPDDKRKKVKQVNGDRYEYMLYLQLKKSLASGETVVHDSIHYRKLEDELIPHKQWLANKDKILAELNLPLLRQPIKTLLETLNTELTHRYHDVNQRIDNRQNKQITLHTQKNNLITWKLPYKKQEDAVNNPFYEKLPNINIDDIIQYVAKKTQFDGQFSHIVSRYTKTQLHFSSLIACMVATATGTGLDRMAAISDVMLNELYTTEKNYFRIETLRNTNDVVVNHIAALPIFQFYTLTEYGIHASIDGQKVQTKTHTIKSRYSKKYFGLKKGVVSYMLVANHLPVNARIIGANEHESHYLLDVIYNQTSNIDIVAVSGDLHSINRVNFALMFLFGYRFMPRLSRLPKQAQNNLVCFQCPDEFSHYLIKPKHQTKKELITQEWDNVLRILASLAMKETTQATIIKKLSSYQRINPTLKALIEFDNIIMSLYMLEYIDDPDMRSHVHRSLNRGESLHQLMSAIRKVGGKQLLGKNEIELEMHNESARLMANCVIYYNAELLSNLYLAYEQQDQPEYCQLLKRLSPVAWQHINFVGKYEFNKTRKELDLKKMIATLMENPTLYFD